jgi:hypothetical protein
MIFYLVLRQGEFVACVCATEFIDYPLSDLFLTHVSYNVYSFTLP